MKAHTDKMLTLTVILTYLHEVNKKAYFKNLIN